MRNKKSEEKYLSVVIGLSFILCFFASHPIMGGSIVQTKESSFLIQKAFDESKIDKDAYLLHQVQAIFAPRTLPMAYKSDATTTSEQDFTPLLKEISLNWDTLREETQRELKPLLLRPTGSYYKPFSKLPNMAYTEKDVISYDTVNFRIHYVRSTDDAPSLEDQNSNEIPDYVEEMGTVFENVYQTEINIMGYAAPPNDVTEGGDSKIDVYIKNIGKYKLYGWASPEGPVSESSWSSWYSFIVMDNDYSEKIFNPHTPPEKLKVTAAHEFHHSVQFGYNAYTENWLMEATSSWIEDEVYDGVNNNILYLDIDDGIFRSPYISLNSTDRYNAYSIWIWIRYLSEYYGRDIIRDIWDKCRLDDNYLHAMSEALIERKTNLANTFLDFTSRNYTKAGSTGEPYKEGSCYPAIFIENNWSPHNVYPVKTQTETIDHLASRYIKFLPQSSATSKTLQISFDGPDGKDCGAFVVIKIKNGGFVEQRIPLDDRNDGSINVPEFSANVGNVAEVKSVESVVLIMNNTTLTNDNLEFSYSAMYLDGQDTQVTPI